MVPALSLANALPSIYLFDRQGGLAEVYASSRPA